MYNASCVEAHKTSKFTVIRTADRTDYYRANGDYAGLVRKNMASWPVEAKGAWVRVIYTNVGNTASHYPTREEAESAMVDYLSL
jgi:hypothetical protein